MRSASAGGRQDKLHEADGSLTTMAFEHRDGRIAAICVVRNPEKLRHVWF